MGELIIAAVIGGVIVIAAFVGILVLDKDIENLENGSSTSKKEGDGGLKNER